MNTTIFNSLKAFAICALLAVTCLSAQSGHPLIVTIPFDFVAANQHFAAGTYKITTDFGSGALLVRGDDNGSAGFALTNATERVKTPAQPKLVFNRYGERYFLSQVWPANVAQGRELHPSKAERELAGGMGKPEIVSLLVSVPHIQKSAR